MEIDFLKDLASYLGLGTAFSELGDDQAAQTDMLIKAMTGPGPESVLPEFKDELTSLRKTQQGYTAAEKEALTSQQRQQLAEKARASGAMGGKMLAGKTRLAATGQAQMQAAMGQMGIKQQLGEQEKQRIQAAKDAESSLVFKAAEIDKKRQTEYEKRKADIGLNIANLKALQSQSK